MSNPILCAPCDTLRGMHTEEVADNAPLSADVAYWFAQTGAAFYEHLTDRPVSGNATATQSGHAHGRDALDGVYLSRHGSFRLGHLYAQSSSSISYMPVLWEMANTGGPGATGEESAGLKLARAIQEIYLDRQYTELVFPVLLKAEGGASAIARLSVWRDGAELVADEQSTSATGWTAVTFNLPIANLAAFSGWCSLKLWLRSDTAGQVAQIADAESVFKPVSGHVLDGSGLLIGETV